MKIFTHDGQIAEEEFLTDVDDAPGPPRPNSPQ